MLREATKRKTNGPGFDIYHAIVRASDESVRIKNISGPKLEEL
jgi:hypothetical protein